MNTLLHGQFWHTERMCLYVRFSGLFLCICKPWPCTARESFHLGKVVGIATQFLSFGKKLVRSRHSWKIYTFSFITDAETLQTLRSYLEKYYFGVMAKLHNGDFFFLNSALFVFFYVILEVEKENLTYIDMDLTLNKCLLKSLVYVTVLEPWDVAKQIKSK